MLPTPIRPRLLPLVLGLAGLLFSGCLSASRSDRDREIRTITDRHLVESRYFEAEQERLERSLADGAVRDFGTRGRILIRTAELIGWWNAAYLRVEYTFLRAGPTGQVPSAITLRARDPSGEIYSQVTEEMHLPFGLSLGPESTYSSWIEVPLEGLHRREGWTWDIFPEGT